MFAARPFRARRGSFAALVLLAPALRSTPLAQGQGAQDRASAVDAGLEAIWADMDAERWDAARSELLALLAGHERDPLLLLARDELIEELETCLFHASWKAPELDDLISGKLVSWDEERGQAELRYTAKQLGDWEQVGKKGDDIIVHPLTFQGSYRAASASSTP